MGIGRDETFDVTAGAIVELSDILVRLDRRIAAVAGIDALDTSTASNVARLRQYLGEVQAQAAWQANEHVRLEAVAEAKRKDEAARVGEIFRESEAIARAIRAGVISGSVRPR